MALSRNPRRANPDDTFTITVDWRRFDNERPMLTPHLAISCR